jgi:hypothetical protein
MPEDPMDPDTPLREQLQAWRLPAPDDVLAERITRRALQAPQRLPPGLRIALALERALTEWRYGLAAKGGALAVCALAGLLVGGLGGVEPGLDELARLDELDVLALAFASTGWEGRP